MSMFGKLLDRSIVFSFDRTGYHRHAKQFVDSQFRPLDSDTHIVVTGGNSGIGYATARRCGRAGARVTIIGRNQERTDAAAERLRSDGCPAIEPKVCDISELADVNRLAGELGAVDVLVHNAGDMIHELERSKDGIERITATHVVGPYVLTRRLIDSGKLTTVNGARVIFVASGGMYTQPLKVQALHTFPKKYDGVVHYALTKRAQVVLANLMDDHYGEAGAIRFAAMHPGWVDTPALSRAMPLFKRVTQPILRTPEQGADTVAWLAICPIDCWSSETRFYFDRRPAPVHLTDRTRRDSDAPKQLHAYLSRFL